MKEKTKDNACEVAREKFISATALPRGRAEMSLEVKNESSFIIIKAHLRATRDLFTRADVVRLRTSLAKAGFSDIRVPDLTETESLPTLCIIADISTRPAMTVASLVHFVKSNPRLFPAGLGTRIEIGDFAGNETHRDFELEANKGCLTLLF